MYDVNKANGKAIAQIREIARQWKEQGKPFWALTASSQQEVEEFRHKHQISEFEFYYGDNTNLKSIIRSNPGLLLIKDTSVVEKTWPSTRLPKFKRILKKSK
jgi:general stress protein 26